MNGINSLWSFRSMVNNSLYMGKIMEECFKNPYTPLYGLHLTVWSFVLCQFQEGPSKHLQQRWLTTHATNLMHCWGNTSKCFKHQTRCHRLAPMIIAFPWNPKAGLWVSILIGTPMSKKMRLSELSRRCLPRELYDQVSAHFHRRSSWLRRRMALGVFVWTTER